MLQFVPFTHKDANFRISAEALDIAQQNIIEQRSNLEEYLTRHPEFGTSFEPVVTHDGAPEIALRMAVASIAAGSVGPMAAVAGTVAQLAVSAAREAGVANAVVENGGDIFIAADSDIRVGLFAGADNPFGSQLALHIKQDSLPLAVCSSSSFMGPSVSLGACDLATVISANASLADAAATQACNSVKTADDIPRVLKQITAIPGIHGALLIKGDKIGMQGSRLPELVKNADADAQAKITIDALSKG